MGITGPIDISGVACLQNHIVLPTGVLTTSSQGQHGPGPGMAGAHAVDGDLDGSTDAFERKPT